jgi:hypothetical protein
MRPFVYALLVLAAFLAAPRHAHACGQPKTDPMPYVAVYVGVTGGMALYDVAAKDPPKAYGAFESLVNAPIAALAGGALINSHDSNTTAPCSCCSPCTRRSPPTASIRCCTIARPSRRLRRSRSARSPRQSCLHRPTVEPSSA